MISAKKVVNNLIYLLHDYGVKHVVISPGSRNAPFIISFTSNKDFTCHSIVDERSAGYFALGMAQQTKSPIALVCTSGTASLNYFPAIAEAYFQHLPLVVITADRPVERIGQGEGQSVFQKHVYGKHVKASVELIENNTNEEVDVLNQRKINEAMIACLAPNQGPVHFNVPLSENLYETANFPATFPRKIERTPIKKTWSGGALITIEQAIQQAKKILILVGSLPKEDQLSNQIAQWGERYGALVLTENTSNILHKNFIHCIDRLIMSFDKQNEEDFHPDLLITLGNNLISKKIKFLLRSKKIKEHWHISEGFELMDTFRALSRTIEIPPKDFFTSTMHFSPKQSNYAKKWKEKDVEISKKQKEFQPHFSDYFVVKTLLELLPKNTVLQQGNSSLVRYAQLFDPQQEITYYANRGTSGIDGCVSTAVGFSQVTDKEVYLLVGDISFFYDNNALWNNYLTKKLKIILVNNGGGGIFDIIEGPSSTDSLAYFTTKHQLDASHLCKMHHIDYFTAGTVNELAQQFEGIKNAQNCSLLEIKTQGIKNDKILKDFFKFIATK